MQLKTKDELEAAGGGGFKSRDELYEAAVDIVVRERRGSCRCCSGRWASATAGRPG